MASEKEQRDRLWESVFDTYYDTYFEEIVADYVSNRWMLVDSTTKVLVAITGSGSAISGWALWNTPGFKFIWIILAGLGAILAIANTALGVPGRLNEWIESKQVFTSLRIDLETLRYLMKINPDFSTKDFTNRFIEHRQRFSDASQKVKNDLCKTSRLKNKAQRELDVRIQIKENK